MKTPVNFKFVLLILLGFGGLSALMVIAGLGNAEPNMLTEDVAPVTVQRVVIQPSYSYSQRVIARVEALTSSAMGFDVSGVVTDIYVDDGSIVKKGDVLASLDTDRLKASKNELLSALKRSQAELTLTELSKSRLENIVKKGLESAQVLDEAMINLEVATASLAQIHAQIASVDVEFKKSHLIAPFDGTVVLRHLDFAESVVAGQPIISLQSDEQVVLRANLPANLVNWLEPGDLVDFANAQHSAVLDRFVNVQNTQTRTQDVLLRVNDEKWQGITGEIVNLVVPVSQSATGAWVPISALSGGIRGMWTLYALNEDVETKITSRLVEVIYADDQRAFVSGAINNDDQIVIEGTQRVVPGQRVRVLRGK